MQISHAESGTTYQITEQNGSVVLLDSSTNRSYSFKEYYEALWCAIELTRISSFDLLNDLDLIELCKRSHISLDTLPKSVMATLKREKINRTYYDQIFLKLLSSYRAGSESVLVSNKTNFIVYHELAHMIRGIMGVRISMTAVKT
jgi:hypothetical protein